MTGNSSEIAFGLLRILATLLHPHEGEALVLGESLRRGGSDAAVGDTCRWRRSRKRAAACDCATAKQAAAARTT
jgi:hypothetical protein